MKKFLLVISMMLITILLSYASYNAYMVKNACEVKNILSVATGDFKLKLNHKRYDKYQELNISEKEIYDFVAKQGINVLNGEDFVQEFQIQGLPENVNLKKVKNALREDYQYIAWWQFTWEITTEDKTTKIVIKTPYGNNGVLDTNYISKAQTALRRAYFNSRSDCEEKLTYFKDVVLDLTAYDEELANLLKKSNTYAYSVRNGNARSFVSVFDGDKTTKALCSGYADAFQLLCDLAGIECYTKIGYVDYSDVLHEWNVVYINDEKYIVDLTTCDFFSLNQVFMQKVEGNTYSVKYGLDKVTYTENGFEN